MPVLKNHPMIDGSPDGFLAELKHSIFRRRIGQIALAIVLAEACIRYLNALVWYLVLPIISNVLKDQTESVLFKSERTFPWDRLFASTLEILAAIIFVFYANRWMYGLNRPRHPEELESDGFPATIPETEPAAPEAGHDL
jgi:large-conductance mechanosensitive channel